MVFKMCMLCDVTNNVLKLKQIAKEKTEKDNKSHFVNNIGQLAYNALQLLKSIFFVYSEFDN